MTWGQGLVSIADCSINPHNSAMTEPTEKEKSQPCNCGSGFEYSQCCGIEGQTALNAKVFAYVSENGVTSEDSMTPELLQALGSIADTPDLFPGRVNLFDGKAWFVKMSPSTYRASVFLDPARIKGSCLIETNLDWLHEACEYIHWQPTSFIFHSAFCGSTLMSQVLETVFNCLSLREPELLNSMLIYNRSNAPKEEKSFWFDSLQRLLSRRFVPDQPVVVKANDYANPVMLDLVDWEPEVPILFMYTPLNEFIAGCLKADNRREWIKQRYESVKPFLAKVFDLENTLKINESDYGELAAVYWSYNITMFLQVSQNPAATIKSLNFNDMLANPKEAVKQCGALFDLKVKKDVDSNAVIGEMLGVYSKNSNIKYSPQQRLEELQKHFAQFSEEQISGEKVARKLLGENYPQIRLPNSLIS
jgi:hypothetical protein